MFHEKGETVRFEAQRAAVLCKRRFAKGDSIDVLLSRDWDEEDGLGEGGAWGWGGYTWRTLRAIASRIVETGRGNTILDTDNPPKADPTAGSMGHCELFENIEQLEAASA